MKKSLVVPTLAGLSHKWWHGLGRMGSGCGRIGIPLPPLRERKADIPALVHYLLKRKTREMGLPTVPTLSPRAIDQLMAYNWPGNVRELDNVLERAVILSRGKTLEFSTLISVVTSKQQTHHKVIDNSNMNLDELNEGHIRQALVVARGRVNGSGGAADVLGINPSTLRHRMRKLGIPFGRRTSKKK